jgi:hypothetical protein
MPNRQSALFEDPPVILHGSVDNRVVTRTRLGLTPDSGLAAQDDPARFEARNQPSQQSGHVFFVKVHEQTAEKDQAVAILGFERQDVAEYGANIRVRGTPFLQSLVERAAALDGNHAGEAVSERLGPVPDATPQVEHRTIRVNIVKQSLNDPGFRPETIMARTRRETKAIHHIWAQD